MLEISFISPLRRLSNLNGPNEYLISLLTSKFIDLQIFLISLFLPSLIENFIQELDFCVFSKVECLNVFWFVSPRCGAFPCFNPHKHPAEIERRNNVFLRVVPFESWDETAKRRRWRLFMIRRSIHSVQYFDQVATVTRPKKKLN